MFAIRIFEVVIIEFTQLNQISNSLFSGCSVARSSRLVWDEEVAGSNPATPTLNHSLVRKYKAILVYALKLFISNKLKRPFEQSEIRLFSMNPTIPTIKNLLLPNRKFLLIRKIPLLIFKHNI